MLSRNRQRHTGPRAILAADAGIVPSRTSGAAASAKLGGGNLSARFGAQQSFDASARHGLLRGQRGAVLRCFAAAWIHAPPRHRWQGLLAVSPALVVTFTHYARHFVNRWTAASFLGVCACVADALVHSSHYTGEYTEALLTGIGAFVFSVVISNTPIGKRIDRLAETFLLGVRAPNSL